MGRDSQEIEMAMVMTGKGILVGKREWLDLYLEFVYG